jgi:choline dehydrogenase-like flavoprotein
MDSTNISLRCGEADYVIVGGGSAGCTLAGRLSEDPGFRVALLEAGGDNNNWVVNTPAAVFLQLRTIPKINSTRRANGVQYNAETSRAFAKVRRTGSRPSQERET